ncbi:MAG TPA: gamma-glutamyltransferase, partial [Actinomycetota bacterium]|nr:gamma-glutamyltransferase [Actinomycetota bacterium]
MPGLFENAAVCSPLTLASEEGRRVLQAGGNVVDAAVATNLMLAVAYPHMCGVGGDLFAIVARDGEVAGLNSSGRLPKAAQLPPDGRVPERGIGAATVPGAVAGWQALIERFGSRSLEELSEQAARLAEEGYRPAPGLERAIERLRDLLARDPGTTDVFLSRSDGRIRMPDLARTLRALDGFYEGVVAHNAPAPWTPDDFASHRAEWVEPMRGDFAGVEVCEMPPNSRGHLVLAALGRLESLEGLTPEDAEWHGRLIRACVGAGLAGDTIHLVVADANGDAVSLTQSLYMG